MHERKPEFLVYASSMNRDSDIKTQVKEMNTRIHQIGIAGPNMDVTGALRAVNLTLEATVGTMHVNAKIVSNRLALHGQNIVVASEALVSTHKLSVIGRKLQLDGKCFPNENAEKREMVVRLNCGLVHVGVDGCIGESNEKETTKTTKLHQSTSRLCIVLLQRGHAAQIVASTLDLAISGSLANYGKISATQGIDLVIGESLLSLSDGTLDSAGRGYDALKRIRGVRKPAFCAPSSSSMHSAISSQNADVVADLIEKGVDVNDKIQTRRLTLRQAAIRECREKRQQSTLNRVRERITLINALLAVHDWRRGAIEAPAIRATMAKNCDDCAQFTAKELHIKTGGSAAVESDSIWSSSYVELDVGSNVSISGQVKLTSFILTAGRRVTTTADAIVALEMFGRISCEQFVCDGIWTAGENIVLEANGAVHFGSHSYVETEKVEMVVGGSCNIHGSWQIGTCWALLETELIIGITAKIFVEESATIGACSLLCHGFVNVTENCDFQFKDSAHFFHSSKFECHTLKMACELHCTLGGVWIADTIEMYVRHDLITTSTGKVAVFTQANLAVGSFRNDSLWQVEKNCQIVVGCIEQSEDGVIFVKENFELYVHRESVGSFAGRIICSRLDLRCLRRCQYDGYLKSNEAEIYLPYMNDSQLIITGQIDVLVSPLTLKGNSSFTDASPTMAHPFPAFILDGRLNAHAVVAPFLAVEFSPQSLVRLFGIVSATPDVDFAILISAGAFTTGRNSSVLSVSENPTAEGIICASTFFHEGQIRFQAPDVHIFVGSLVHNGRLTNCENRQNHLTRCHIAVEETFLNEGTLACNVLNIRGEGVLENRNRIFAAESMDIRLNNFNNEDGSMESKNSIKLLSATKEWTKINGSIKAKRGFDLCAHKLDMALKDVHKLFYENKLSFSARSELLFSTDICDESKEFVVGCAARNVVTINAMVELDRLEILLGDKRYATQVLFKLSAGAGVDVNTVIINGCGSRLVVVVDGTLRCKRLKIADAFENVTITGKGSIDTQMLSADCSHICFDMSQIFITNDLFCKSLTVQKGSPLRLKSSEDHDSTTVTCEKMLIDGTLFIERKLLVNSRKSDAAELQIRGPIIGTYPESELSVETNRLSISGQMANLKLVEFYARDNAHFSAADLRNIQTLTIDCAELILNADITSCDSITINADVLNMSGNCSGSHCSSGSLSVCCSSIQSSLSVNNLSKLNINCRRAAMLNGDIEDVDNIEIDAKWINSHASLRKCGTVKLAAWSVHCCGSLLVNRLMIASLGAVLVNGEVRSADLDITAPFIIAVQPSSALIAQQLELNSICVCTRGDLQLSGTNYLWFVFEETLNRPSVSLTQANNWKETAEMMRDRFGSPTIDVDEVIVGLKYLSDLNVTKIVLEQSSAIYEELRKMSQRFDRTPISLFSIAELVLHVYRSRSKVVVAPTEKVDDHIKSRRRNNGSVLYEKLVQFKSTKYGKEVRVSSDTDVGYVSRSSSEELDRSRSPPSSVTPSCSLFTDNHFTVVEEKLDHSFANDVSIEELNSCLIEQEELDEFEMIEQEIEECEEGLAGIITNTQKFAVVTLHQRTFLSRLRRRMFTAHHPVPKPHFPIIRIPSSNDLVLKRLQVKATLSNLDLRSFGSEASLNLMDLSTVGDIGTPMQFAASPFQR
ncbi:unnamed protein product [Nippostrongylus brasiliensis]|uniref:ANK_REP_REGION domain-containing protein n=1 Tax=Nippostrongylus brasiliensis TaxID=27835 RepID=A0A158QY15_NIPBR|nr:unnamed protein product [Nippostrongylus brasiliensis]